MKLWVLIVILAGPLLGACGTTRTETWIHESEITLLLPESLRPVEERVERVTCLLASGRALVFEDAVAYRVGDRVVVDTGPDTPVLASFSLTEVRAVQFYRTRTRGPD